MEALRSRIAHSVRLGRLKLADIDAYPHFRMAGAGWTGPKVFSTNAVRSIAKLSGGIARRIDLLADKALLSAAHGRRRDVGGRDVAVAAEEIRGARRGGAAARAAAGASRSAHSPAASPRPPSSSRALAWGCAADGSARPSPAVRRRRTPASIPAAAPRRQPPRRPAARRGRQAIRPRRRPPRARSPPTRPRRPGRSPPPRPGARPARPPAPRRPRCSAPDGVPTLQPGALIDSAGLPAPRFVQEPRRAADANRARAATATDTRPPAGMGHASLGYNRGLSAARCSLPPARPTAGPRRRPHFETEPPMDAERLNQIDTTIADLRRRLGELRRYL
jgi:hypothetical protein